MLGFGKTTNLASSLALDGRMNALLGLSTGVNVFLKGCSVSVSVSVSFVVVVDRVLMIAGVL